MRDENRALVMELAYILHRRNQIEVRRRRAKSKIGYYEDIKTTIKAYKKDVASLRDFNRVYKATDFNMLSELQRLNMIGELRNKEAKVESYNNCRSRPFKFLDKVSELNKRILKHRRDYMQARYDAAKLTCSTRKRVTRIIQLLQCTIDYQMGTAFVGAISFKDGKADRITSDKFEAMYREVEANKAIDKMLRSPNEEEKETS